MKAKQMHKHLRPIYLAVAVTVFAVIIVYAAGSAPNIRMDLRPSVDLPQRTVSQDHAWDWTTQAWVGNDLPYQSIRTQIDQAIAQGSDPQRLLALQMDIARQYPNNPQAQFAWGYAAFVSTSQLGSSHKRQKVLAIPSGAMANLPATDSYNYTRLRFLLTHLVPYANAVQSRSNQRLLEALGQRLLQHDTNDDATRYKLVQVEIAILGWKPFDPLVRARALKHAQELVQAKPDTMAYQVLPGDINTACWAQTNDPNDARAGIASYQAFLKVAPANDEFRPTAKELIGVMQKFLTTPK